MAERFAGKVALIAGGTGALGRAVSLAFLDELAHVVVTYQREGEFIALKNATGAHFSSLEGYRVDVTDEVAVRRLTAKILAQHAHLDILVDAVGGYAGGTPLWEVDSAVFDRMLALNLRSAFVLSRVVVPVMVKQGTGAILNVASRSAFDHAAGAAAYAASKSAAVALMDSLAADLRGTNVRANSILPSIIDTEANRKAMPGADYATWPKPDDIARVILFLCSEDAKLVHGAAVPVYGNA
jgi:NAD(P)-dependent dehydrogenase (short-subunit alcohol dehydrogenase family)